MLKNNNKNGYNVDILQCRSNNIFYYTLEFVKLIFEMTLKNPILPEINKERTFCCRYRACKVKAATDDQFVWTMAYLLTITVHILSFRQPVLTIEIIAHVREFLSTAAVDVGST